MFSLEDAKHIRGVLINKQYIEMKKSKDSIVGREYISYIYDNEEARDKHAKEMELTGWEYMKDSGKCREALYFSFYDEENEIYVLCAEFKRRVKSSLE